MPLHLERGNTGLADKEKREWRNLPGDGGFFMIDTKGRRRNMAVNTNTTKTIKRTSTVLGGKCDATKENMKKLIRQAGCAANTAMEKVTIPLHPGDKDDVVFVGLNGADFYFKRGEPVEMPKPVADILRNARVMK